MIDVSLALFGFVLFRIDFMWGLLLQHSNLTKRWRYFWFSNNILMQQHNDVILSFDCEWLILRRRVGEGWVNSVATVTAAAVAKGIFTIQVH